MTTAKRILLIIVAQWILAIAAGVFTPQSRAALRKSVWDCLTGKSANTALTGPPIGGMDIYIQYCGGWGYGYAKKSKQLKKDLEEVFNGQISVRQIRDPGATGNFEVVVNGEKVWSKKNGQGFPKTPEKVETIIAAIRIKKNRSPTTTMIKSTIAGLDIHIQYCGGWGFGSKSKQLKNQLEEAFDGQISVRETRDPGVTGNFEVFVNGELVWSKRTWGQEFPTTKAEVDTICDEIRERQNGRA